MNTAGLLDETLSHPVIILTFPCSPRVKSSRYLKQDTFEHLMIELEDIAREDIATITPFAGDDVGTVDVKVVFFPYVEGAVIEAAVQQLRQVPVSSPCGSSDVTDMAVFWTEPEIGVEQVDGYDSTSTNPPTTTTSITVAPTAAPTAAPTVAPADTNPTINGDTNYWLYDAAISDEFDSAGSIDATKWTDDLNGWIGTLFVSICANTERIGR